MPEDAAAAAVRAVRIISVVVEWCNKKSPQQQLLLKANDEIVMR